MKQWLKHVLYGHCKLQGPLEDLLGYKILVSPLAFPYVSFKDDEDRYLHGRVRRKKINLRLYKILQETLGLWSGNFPPSCYKITVLLGNEEWMDKNTW